MKKRFLLVLIAICAISLALFVSCGKKKGDSQSSESESTIESVVSSRYSIEGVTDIALSITHTEYDFLKGVVGWDGTSIKAVTVDSSSVQFGKVGVYEITYTLGDLTKKANVRVYGIPEITGETEYEAYYAEDLDVFAEIEGKDSFGAELLITTNNEFARDELGRIIYGEHFFRYYVTDSVGNQAYLDRTYTVMPPEGYDFRDVVVTADNPAAIIDISGKVLSYIAYQGEKILPSEYVINGSKLDVSYFVLDLGVGRHDLNLSFEGGYSDVTVDVQITARQYYGRDIEGEDMVYLFKPYDENTTNYVGWDEEENAFHFVNNVISLYDDRGFYLDMDYFTRIIEKANASYMTFEVKFDETENVDELAFYIGFIPSWFNKPTMQQKFYTTGYIPVTIDLSMVEKNGDRYKTLFMLATYGGFYVRNIQFTFAD